MAYPVGPGIWHHLYRWPLPKRKAWLHAATVSGCTPADINIIQGELSAKGTDPTLNFSAATAGNLLVLWAARRDSTTISTPSGWTLVPEGTNSVTGGRGGALFYRVAAGGETSVQVIGVSVVISFCELSGVDTSALLDSAAVTNATGTAYEAGGAVDASGHARVVLIGGTIGDYFGNSNNVSAINGTVEFNEETAPGDEKPGVWFAMKVIDNPTSSEKIEGTGPNADHSGNTIAFAAQCTGGGGVTGTASQGFGFSTAAQGTETITGASSQAFGFATAASGTETITGTSSQAFGFTTDAGGMVVEVVGASTQGFGFATAALGTETITGASAQAFGIGTVGSGAETITGASAQAFGFTTVSVGTETITGASAQAFGFVTTGAGVTMPNVTGTSSQGFGFALAGVGNIPIPPITWDALTRQPRGKPRFPWYHRGLRAR